jgi:signal transduction histidine kinase
MRRSLAALAALVLAVPGALAFVLGIKSMLDASAAEAFRRREAMEGGLAEGARAFEALAADWEARAFSLLARAAAEGRAGLPALARVSPLVDRFFMLDSHSELAYPLAAEASNLDMALIDEMPKILEAFSPRTAPEGAAEAESGWMRWYGSGGLRLGYWRRSGDGYLCAALEMGYLKAELAARCADVGFGYLGPGEAVRMVDESGGIFYLWGDGNEGPAPSADAPLAARIPLPAPLASWGLERFGPGAAAEAGIPAAWIVAGAAFFAALGAGAWALFREIGRGMRLAEQRQSFVNQVSHELKTPLTNIRLYAELLAARLERLERDRGEGEDLDKARAHAAVIGQEAQRLSRLIANVLSFAKDSPKVRPSRIDPAEAARTVLDSFAPSLERRGMALEAELEEGLSMMIDAEALAQILANLVSNAEKYAAEGRLVSVRLWAEGDMLMLRVADRGGGVPESAAERIFAPFERLHDKASDGAGGTGLGLHIARGLARAHGGDLALEKTEQGASFLCSLKEGGTDGADTGS